MSRVSRISWIWVGCAAVVTYLGCLGGGATVIADAALVSIGLIWCATLPGTALCMRNQSACAFAVPLQSFAHLIAVSVTFAFLQYPAAQIARPLIDGELAAFDRALHFDWPACFGWVLQHPTGLSLLSAVYLSLGLQSALLCLLGWREPDRVGVCLAANVLTLTCCLIVFVMWPAGGAFAYYQPADIVSDYVEQFTAARSGLVTALTFGQLKGIIQFPSHHAAAAVLLGYAFASLPLWLAVPALAIEITLALSAIPIGGHHLADVLAGIAVATVSLAVARAFAKAGLHDRPQPRPEVESVAVRA